MKTRVPQFATLIPLLGYAILWSDQFEGWIMKFDRAFGGGSLLTPSQRVEFLYFGSVLILLGMVVFWLLCPRPLRYGSLRDYLMAVAETADPREATQAAQFVRPNKPGEGSFVLDGFRISTRELSLAMNGTVGAQTTNVQSAYYEGLDRNQPVRSGSVFALLAGGALIFLVPSVEVFFLAMVRLFTV